MKQIIVLLLAGGDSTRLWPLEEKLAIPFLGKSLIFHALLQLSRFALTQIVIVHNKKNKSLFERISETFPHVSITLVEQKGEQGMAGAVISAQKYIGGKELLVIGPSDIYEDILLSDFFKLVRTPVDGILAGLRVNTYFPGAYLTLKGNTITGIVEKPLPSQVPSNIVNFVFDYFRNANILLDAIEKSKSTKDDVYEKAIEKLLKEGITFKLLPYTGYWGYLKYPWHILSLSSYFLGKIKGKKVKNAYIDKSAVISGNVYIEDGVKILENVKIIGPAYIGKGTLIGNNSIIRESIIGENCVVGFTTEIARSYIGDNCWFHHNYLGDSIVSNNVSMGAGTVLANFRLDEQVISSLIGKKVENTGKTKLGAMIGKQVRIGVNTSLMPGVKIGRNSFIGAATLINEDVADNTFVSMKNGKLVAKENKVFIKDSERESIRLKLKI